LKRPTRGLPPTAFSGQDARELGDEIRPILTRELLAEPGMGRDDIEELIEELVDERLDSDAW